MPDKDLSVQDDINNILPLKIADGLDALELWEQTVKRLRMAEAITDNLAQQRGRDAQDQFIAWNLCDLMSQCLAFQGRLHEALMEMLSEKRASAADAGEGQS